MKNKSNEIERKEEKLEAILLEGINSGLPTPLTRDDFEAIRKRGVERVKSKTEKIPHQK